MIGRQFGKWTVVSLAQQGGNGKHHRWLARCVCGTERVVNGSGLRSGASRSCGCTIQSKKKTISVGEVFGHLTIIQILPNDSDANRRCLVRCVCGAEKSVRTLSLFSKRTRSCGCKLLETRYRKHGQSHGHITPEYRSWRSMRDRVNCKNQNSLAWRYYGARGITVCKRWDDFLTFLADVGPRPSPQHSLDRIDGNGNYEPGNVRWATKSEQSQNTSRSIREDERNFILSEYTDGTKVLDIVRKTGRSFTTISCVLREAGIPRRARTAKPALPLCPICNHRHPPH